MSALLAPAGASAKISRPSPPRIEVPTPAPGDITIEGITTTIPTNGGKAPKLRFTAANSAALPPGVIVLTATRAQRGRRSTTDHTVVVALDRRSASAARAHAASEKGLTPYGNRPNSLIDGGQATHLIRDDALVYLFTGIVPSQTNTWEQDAEARPKNAEHLDQISKLLAGAQPNANAGATDPRACRALTAAVPPEPPGKLPSGLDIRYFGGVNVMPWNDKGITQALEDVSRNCHAGPGGLTAIALASLEKDLGLGAGELGPVTSPAPTPAPTPAPGPTPIGPEEFGAVLDREPDRAAEAEVDFVLWLEELIFGPAPASVSFGVSGPGGPDARAASAANAVVPANGQVTKVSVRGYYVAGSCPGKQPDSTCAGNVHFQDLRPLPNGKLEVVSTTQAFTLAPTPGTYTFEPTNFFVQKGDYIGLATVGGKFFVLVSSSGAKTAMFRGHNQDMNGAQISSNNSQPGEELNMRVRLQPTG